MRLTLRTLLAYLDDVLDPADREELAQKIESSEFAEDLVHRTRDTMRRLRLSAPQVIGTGIALDPNTVSEYLDNVLPPEQVGDFERVCLESDVHLAEAAACHHVLTMVLGEPADFDPRMRQRMYGVPTEARERKRIRVEQAHGATAAVKPPLAAERPAAMPAGGAPVAPQPTAPVEIPEYLRTRSWWQSRVALAALAAALLAGVALYLTSGLRGWFGGTPQAAALAVERGEPLAAAGTTGDVGSSGLAPMQPLAPPPPLTTSTAPQTSSAAGAEPVEPAVPEAVTSEPTNDRGSSAAAPDESAVTPAAEVDRYGFPIDEAAAATRPTELDAPATAAVPDAVEPNADAIAMSVDSPLPPDVAIEERGVARDVAAMEEEVPAGPPELGTYLGGKTILLTYDDQTGAWLRLGPRDAVFAGQRFVALPEFRPKVSLVSGLHMDISGGTQIVLGTADALQAASLPSAGPEVPAVEVVYGRLVLINTSMKESAVRLKLGPHIADARLARNATLGVEVERQHVPGLDPRQTPSPVVVRLFAPDGGVSWQDASGERTAELASRWTIGDEAAAQVVADDSPPEWIDHEPTEHLSEQRFGAPVVEGAVVPNRPLDVQLLELFQSNPARREVKSLVTRSSIHVGLFEPFVEALRDSEQRANWASHIAALRGAMALSPQTAQSVWQALVAQRGERAAADLYEMLRGYNLEQIGHTPEQRKAGALARLIDWLEEESLDYRVLAVHDLAEITGKRLMSNPAGSVSDREQSVRRWRSRLASDELRPVAER